MLRVGVIGGTFDPIHYGHLFIAENARHFFQLDKVIFIPTGLSPHKPADEVTDKSHRYNMTALAIQGNDAFEVSDIEISKDCISYTVNTIAELKQIAPNAFYFYITGTDWLHELTGWRDFQYLSQAVEFISVNRELGGLDDVFKTANEITNKYGTKIHILKAPIIEISSSEIRRRAKRGLPVKYMLPKRVEQYIKANNLYK